MTTFSVSSNSSSDGSRPLWASAWATVSTKSVRSNCMGETLTATLTRRTVPSASRVLAAGLRQYPGADGNNHAAFLRHRDELRGRNEAEPGMAPGQQGFQARQCCRSCPPAAGSTARAPEFSIARRSVFSISKRSRAALPNSPVKNSMPFLAAVLGAVHGRCRRSCCSVDGVLSVPRIEADADAGSQEQLVAFDLERIPQRIQQLPSDLQGVVGLTQPGEGQRELVAAQPRQSVALAEALLQTPARPARAPRRPAAWPSVSLICLKRSRSMKSTASSQL